MFYMVLVYIIVIGCGLVVHLSSSVSQLASLQVGWNDESVNKSRVNKSRTSRTTCQGAVNSELSVSSQPVSSQSVSSQPVSEPSSKSVSQTASQ